VDPASESAERLKPWERAVVAAGAALAGLAALALMLLANTGTEIDRDGAGRTIRSVQTPQEHTELVVVLAATAAILLLWAVNAVRFTKFAAPGVSLESGGSAIQRLPWDEKKKITQTDPSEEIIEMAVYRLQDLPQKVLKDLLDQYDEAEGPKPPMSDLKFVARRDGKGNHPWFFGIGPRLYRLAYGGRGKAEPSLTWI
jgi:hypothetical protein